MDSLLHWFIDSLVHWFTDSLVHLFIGSWNHWFIGSTVHCLLFSWLIDSTDSLLQWIFWFIDSMVHWFRDALVHDSSVHSFTHSLIPWFVDSLIHRFIVSPFHRCIDSLIHRIIGSLVHSVSRVLISFMSFRWHLINHLLSRWCISQLQHFIASASHKLSFRPVVSYSCFICSKLPAPARPGTTLQYSGVSIRTIFAIKDV